MLQPYHHMTQGLAKGDAPLIALHQAFARIPFLDERRFDLPAEQVRSIKREYIDQARTLADTLGLDAVRSSRDAMEAAMFVDFGEAGQSTKPPVADRSEELDL